MPTDPKWRLIARRSGATISEVVNVFLHMMVNASTSGLEGEMRGWNDEVVATAIDVETSVVEAIRAKMQGVVLDGDALLGWAIRQPKSATSTDRVRAFRSREGAALPPPDPAPPETPPEPPPEAEPKKARKKRRAIDASYQPDESDKKAAINAGLDAATFRREWSRFRDYHVARGTLMLDWNAAWRTWLSNYQKGSFLPRGGGAASNGHESNFIKAAREQLRKIEDACPDKTSPVASTLPDASFHTASDPLLAPPPQSGNAYEILDLPPIRTERGNESDLD